MHLPLLAASFKQCRAFPCVVASSISKGLSYTSPSPGHHEGIYHSKCQYSAHPCLFRVLSPVIGSRAPQRPLIGCCPTLTCRWAFIPNLHRRIPHADPLRCLPCVTTFGPWRLLRLSEQPGECSLSTERPLFPHVWRALVAPRSSLLGGPDLSRSRRLCFGWTYWRCLAYPT